MATKKRKRTFDMISIGDSTLDTFVRVSEASLMCTVDRETCLLCFNYADKIPITSLNRTVAGNAANNAVGSSRLGLKAAFYSVVGNDEIGQRIISKMKEEKVSTAYLQVDKKHPSNYSIVLNYKAERTILTYSEPRTYRLPKLASSYWAYYTAIGANHHRMEASLIKYIKANDVRLGYNPGTSQLKLGFDRMSPMLQVTEVLFLNKQEAQELIGKHRKINELLEMLYDAGPKIIVITDGPRGSHAFDGRTKWKMGIYPARVIEMTGAGDAFSTGFLAALQHGKGIEEALKWGSANSAGVVSQVGPQAGLLKLSQIRGMIKKYKSVKPRIVK